LSIVPLRDLFRRQAETKMCVACDATLPLSANFCSNCGVRVDDPEAQPLHIVDRATGLFNDRFIRPLLDDELARAHRYGRLLGVVLIQPIQDHGVPEPSPELQDDMLRSMATAVVSTLREVDTPGVLSRRPPALLALLPDTDIAGTGFAAARVLDSVNSAFGPNGRRAAIGIVCVQPGQRLRAGSVIEAADRSMRSGRPELLGR
jgi:PleD family two-component response regulator